jgi:hypothetical protein
VEVVVYTATTKVNHKRIVYYALTMRCTQHHIYRLCDACGVKQNTRWGIHNTELMALESARYIRGEARTEAYDICIVAHRLTPRLNIYLCTKFHNTILGQRYTNNRKKTYLCTIICKQHKII